MLDPQENVLRMNISVELRQFAIRVMVQFRVARESPIVPQPCDAGFEPGEKFVDRGFEKEDRRWRRQMSGSLTRPMPR